MRKAFIYLFVTFFVCLSYADDRDSNLDLYIVMDKSLSMEEEIDQVKEYIESFLIDKLLIPGDKLYLVPFYGEAYPLFDGQEVTSNNYNVIKNKITAIKANGQYTDIGNALDKLNTIVDKSSTNRKYFLLLTDGKQEAPPESQYYSPDGTYNHPFLDNIRIIRDQGWKVIVLGLGSDEDAKELAEQLSAGYSSFADATKTDPSDFVGIFQLKDSPELKIYKDKAHLILSIEGEGMDSPKSINIDKIIAEDENNNTFTILESYETALLDPNKMIDLDIDIDVSKVAGKFNANNNYSLRLSFLGQQQIVPSVYPLVVTNIASDTKSTISESEKSTQSSESRNNLALFIILGLLLVIIIVFIILVIKNRVPSDDEKKRKKVIDGDTE
ncbi:vWA domain-containing protein [Spirochaeta cellobiosiphila]|uniref:vWA domain-containing protein n=1 Tax=Spirochaeta cellobiosiphila TaxID=504483 RepID=UPI000417ACFB|nr:vWA domain-containing protein [Spirochaeta cellobiosiphila]